jgi:uncharacterized membrane protein
VIYFVLDLKSACSLKTNELTICAIKYYEIMKNFYGSFYLKAICYLFLLFFVVSSPGFSAAAESDSVKLYTPYTRISVPPGQSIDYSIDIINHSSEIQDVDISVSGIPRGWTYDLKSGGWTIDQLSVLPGEMKTVNLKLDVPLNVNKGIYRFSVLAGKYGTLLLSVRVSEQGSDKTEFTCNQANMQGKANQTFSFTASLKNRTAEQQNYAFISGAPRGWVVTFRANYQPATSITTEPNSTSTITIEAKPPESIQAGTYKIPVSVTNGTTSANLELEVVITGTYILDLNTPTGLMSTDITAGDVKRIQLVVNNTGSAELQDIKLDFAAPVNWDVTFDPKTIARLDPGKFENVYATIKAYKKAIPGDYVTTIEAKTPEVATKISFRVSVETRLLWGWIGVLVIIFAVGIVYYLFRKYGRR